MHEVLETNCLIFKHLSIPGYNRSPVSLKPGFLVIAVTMKFFP